MKIQLAKSAGFCFGVDRAVQLVFQLLEQGKQVYTLGPIIHNPQLVSRLEQRGVQIVDDPDQVSQGGTLVIRSHGVAESVLNRIRARGLDCADATCPFVRKIHRIVSKASQSGQTVLIAGDPRHPEIEGVVGYCSEPPYIFKNAPELADLLEKHPEFSSQDVCIIAQTTFSLEEWRNCLQILKKVCTNATVFDTICNATVQRQSEASELSQKSDLMLVIGGRHSSNTAKLQDVCAQNCITYLIEKAEELPLQAVKGAVSIGITAGASTPASIIKEVLDTMTEIIEGAGLTEQESAESNFEEMLEESLKSLNTDEKVRGVVVGIAPNEIYVDVGRKQAGFVPLSELSADPNAKAEDLVKIGDELDLLIMRTNDQEGTIMLSKKRLDAVKGWEIIAEAEENETVLTGIVTEVIKGGVIAVTEGVRVFIPASQATASRNDPLDALLKQEVKFRIIEVNRQRRRAVGSIRSVLKDERKLLADKFWETAEEGKEYTGVVKSLTAYGAFVDLGGIDGMVHISELSWNRIKHPSEVVNVGDTVTVYIKGLDQEKSKISLGYKRSEDNPWEILKRDYPVGTTAEVQVVGLTTFGAFARIIPGIDGLIHISQIADHRIEKPQDALKTGDKVTVKITDIDFDKHRVSLSIRAYLEEQAASGEESAEAPATEE
ncbi:bifunctional 4-hydroxy-3-methylbut-2-enyl diphosphate reductase/30S ribosomal protein S1 [Clostridium minihomine]|uniref:bifunctional 4-hydroxy-3-methylbut-2-enyl diphosphate reductase/30S ribosomal protein S1 n=1 Tax=Clostridium minihomine TaxID=2045012 RepID=UPI000C771A0B|nr:bifunctional 4-hydroxy-3-methylbut-2-enyl diphosphate reductase/30S ribosomal protein S1 [Clostridium minihomine]